MKLNFFTKVIFFFYTNMYLLLLTVTCFSRALNVTCHLEFMLLSWLNVMFNFHNLFINNQRVSQETNPHTCSIFFLKLMPFISIAKASHLGEKKLSDCFSQFKLNWNAFIWNSGRMCFEILRCFNIKYGVRLKKCQHTVWFPCISKILSFVLPFKPITPWVIILHGFPYFLC